MRLAAPDALPEFRALIARELGLWMEDHRTDFLASVLEERWAAGHHDGPAAYLEHLAQPAARPEWAILGARLTIPETYFLRGPEHFQALVDPVLPERLQRRGAPLRPLRFLSAGCASGEEPYSLALTLHERLPLLAHRDVEILGVDLSRDALARARAARYSTWSLRETPPALREKYFQRHHQEFVLNEAIRARVRFEERNLHEPNPDLWQAGAFDVIFCRNVLMYFVPAAAAALVERMRYALAPDGVLFLGHAETLRGLSQAYHLRNHAGAFFYQVRPLEPPAVPPTPAASTRGSASGLVPSPLRATAGPPFPPVRPTPPADAPAPRAPAVAQIHALHQQERFAEALTLLQGLRPTMADDADLQVLQAVLLVNSGQLAAAEALCRPLLGRDECNASAHYLLALCREHAGELAAAAEHDALAAYLDPSFAMPRFHLGLLGKRLGQGAAVLGHFEAALALFLKEDSTRVLLFGGGFTRDALLQLCRSEIRQLGGPA